MRIRILLALVLLTHCLLSNCAGTEKKLREEYGTNITEYSTDDGHRIIEENVQCFGDIRVPSTQTIRCTERLALRKVHRSMQILLRVGVGITLFGLLADPACEAKFNGRYWISRVDEIMLSCPLCFPVSAFLPFFGSVSPLDMALRFVTNFGVFRLLQKLNPLCWRYRKYSINSEHIKAPGVVMRHLDKGAQESLVEAMIEFLPQDTYTQKSILLWEFQTARKDSVFLSHPIRGKFVEPSIDPIRDPSKHIWIFRANAFGNWWPTPLPKPIDESDTTLTLAKGFLASKVQRALVIHYLTHHEEGTERFAEMEEVEFFSEIFRTHHDPHMRASAATLLLHFFPQPQILLTVLHDRSAIVRWTAIQFVHSIWNDVTHTSQKELLSQLLAQLMHEQDSLNREGILWLLHLKLNTDSFQKIRNLLSAFKTFRPLLKTQFPQRPGRSNLDAIEILDIVLTNSTALRNTTIEWLLKQDPKDLGTEFLAIRRSLEARSVTVLDVDRNFSCGKALADILRTPSTERDPK